MRVQVWTWYFSISLSKALDNMSLERKKARSKGWILFPWNLKHLHSSGKSANKWKSQAKVTSLLHFGSYFSNLIFFRLFLPKLHETNPLHFVPCRCRCTHTHTHTHTHTYDSRHKVLFFILNYPAIPALSPFPGSCSKAQTLLITYPKPILPTKTVAILSRRAVCPAKTCSVPNPFAARGGHETHFLSWDATQRKSARELRKVFALVTQALLSLPCPFLLCPFSFPFSFSCLDHE